MSLNFNDEDDLETSNDPNDIESQLQYLNFKLKLNLRQSEASKLKVIQMKIVYHTLSSEILRVLL
jgi:hypothetical protein